MGIRLYNLTICVIHAVIGAYFQDKGGNIKYFSSDEIRWLNWYRANESHLGSCLQSEHQLQPLKNNLGLT